MDETLLTDRLRLRFLYPEDVTMVVALINHWEIIQWLASVPWPYTLKDGEDFQRMVAADHATGQPTIFAVADKASDALLGMVGLRSSFLLGEAELGYWLGLAHWHKGLMTEAVQAMVAYGLEKLELRRIYAVTNLANDKSRRVLEKAGLRYVGIQAAPDRLRDTRCTEMVHVYEILEKCETKAWPVLM